MGAGVIVLIVVVAIILIAAFILLGIYNGLVQSRVRTKEAWSGIDVQLKRRADLVPNLVETVKGYASHEKETFENVTNARSMLQNAQGPADAAAANNMLTQTLRSLFAVAEAYPELKASENFMQMQRDLSDIESLLDAHPKLDTRRILRWVREFSTALEMPEILRDMKSLLSQRRKKKKAIPY